ncbi:MAG: leucine--tRNA ligase [Planctomycetota bacterium]|nr:MAG: leucine--tRNA ligase [Planctomycetota bacterium]
MAEPSNADKPGAYHPAAIEPRWREYWETHGTFRTPNPGDPDFDASKPKFYVLDMFPYPSGAGLHVGHPVGYCATDIIARYKRMRGYNVLHPMGFDAFGLPAEQYAIEHNVHPAVTTRKNIDRYREQLKMFGFSYDWSRELATCDPRYYKFTQWIFLKMFESWYDPACEWVDPQGRRTRGRARPIRELLDRLESGDWGVDAAGDLVRERIPGRREWSELTEQQRREVLDRQRLAYMAEVPVNWCPALGTVLANEEVTSEGRSDRGNHPVYRRPLRQWMLRITRYADRLLEDLEELDWPEPIKIMQRNWIGRSTGAEVVFPLARSWSIREGAWRHADGTGIAPGERLETLPDVIRVYTTRPDTLFGATYMVLAPEHELVASLTTPDRKAEVEAYVKAAMRRSELERTAESKEKTGVFTGSYAINPVNGERIPIWVADYVLMGYGTGAIMAVPGGDTRDFEFARRFDLPIVAVVRPTEEWIAERLATMLAGVEDKARSGLQALAEEFPDLSAEVEAVKERSAGLSDKTLRVLRERVGLERLADHYVRHPQAWGEAFTGEGTAVQSPGDRAVEVPGGVCRLDGLPTAEAKQRIVEWLERQGLGRSAVQYKLRDWVFSRQKYWGEPFPVLHGEDGSTIALSEDELPVELPEMEDFRPTPVGDDPEAMPEPPLARAKEWLIVRRDGRTYRRDVNTMPQWAGSCWYYLRFLDPGNDERFCDERAERYWMPVDLYVGGAEHAVLHLLYARFWHKVLFDLGYVSTREPFRRLFNQGMIQGFAFKDRVGRILPADAVEQRGPEAFVSRETGEPVTRVIAKMSKSLKNVVNPDEIIAEWGADTFRLYEMYMGPLDASKPWNTRDVPGLYKLCQRIWRLVVDERTGDLSPALTDGEPDEEALRALHKLVRRVTGDIEQLKFNTAIAAIFDFVNFLTPREIRPRAVVEPFLRVLAPFAPHLAEELWHRLGHEKTIAYEPWPEYDERLARDEEVEVGVQINGKLRARVTVPADADEQTVREAALAEQRVAGSLKGKTIRKVIVVKGRLVNIVAT